MINLTRLPSRSTANLSRVNFKRSGDDDGLIWDVDLTFSIDANAMVAMEAMVAGAAALVESAETRGTRTTQTDTTPREDVQLVVTGGENERLLDTSAEVRFTKLHVHGPLAKATIRFRVRGTAEARIGLIRNYGEQVDVECASRQQSLFDRPPTRPVIEGQVVTWPEGVGMARAVRGDQVEVADFDGSLATVRLEDVMAAVTVAAPQGTNLQAQLESYARRAKRKGIDCSWASILSGLRDAVGSGAQPDNGGAWVLTDDVIDAALGIGAGA